MSRNEASILLLCLIVLILMSALFAYLICLILGLRFRCVRCGLDDPEIERAWQEHRKNLRRDRAAETAGRVVNLLAGILTAALLLSALVFTIAGKSRKVGRTPLPKTVESPSMSYKNRENRYLFDRGLNDQVTTDSLILLRRMPPEGELRLYDVVLYEYEGMPVLHRIVGIKEEGAPGATHRVFTFQGDANPHPDGYPVLYGQMRGIYRGEHIREVGDFVKFLRSPVGYICLIVVILVTIAYPFAENRIYRARLERLAIMGYDVGIDPVGVRVMRAFARKTGADPDPAPPNEAKDGGSDPEPDPEAQDSDTDHRRQREDRQDLEEREGGGEA